MNARNPIRYAETAIVAIVGLWLAYGLLSNPAALSVVVTFAAVLSLLVVLPALLVWAVGSESDRLVLHVERPSLSRRRTPAEPQVPVPDGGARQDSSRPSSSARRNGSDER